MIVLATDTVTVARCTTRQPCERCSDDYTRMVSRETHQCSPPMLQGFVTTATEPPVEPGDRIALAATDERVRPGSIGCTGMVVTHNLSDGELRLYLAHEDIGQGGGVVLHPGHIVATATVAMVKRLGVGVGDPTRTPRFCVRLDAQGVWAYGQAVPEDQRPLADWSPGRWAVKLVNVTLTTEPIPHDHPDEWSEVTL